MKERLSILILVPGAVGDRLAGPQIRGLELARVLNRTHRVTVALNGEGRSLGHLRVVGAGRARVLWEALRHDVVIAPWHPPFLLPVLAALGVLVVADLYDPVEHEITTADEDVGLDLASVRCLTDLQLRFATIVACGGDRQRAHLINRSREVRDSSRGLATVVVPFGLPPPPAPLTGHPLREELGLSTSDFVVLWWGALWRWLDPETAIRATALLRERRPDVKLVLSAGPPPHRASRALVKTGQARRLAESLNVLDETVFFMETWIPYVERHAYIGDADLGITLHRDPAEANRAARARYLDYLWCSLPCVLARGDELADTLATGGCATLINPGDVVATAMAIGHHVEDAAGRESAKKAARSLAESYRWPRVVQPLQTEIESTGRQRASWLLAFRTLPAIFTFYLARCLGVIRAAWRRSI